MIPFNRYHQPPRLLDTGYQPRSSTTNTTGYLIYEPFTELCWITLLGSFMPTMVNQERRKMFEQKSTKIISGLEVWTIEPVSAVTKSLPYYLKRYDHKTTKYSGSIYIATLYRTFHHLLTSKKGNCIVNRRFGHGLDVRRIYVWRISSCHHKFSPTLLVV